MAEKYEVVKRGTALRLVTLLSWAKYTRHLNRMCASCPIKLLRNCYLQLRVLALTTKRAKRQSLPDSMRWALSIKQPGSGEAHRVVAGR